MGVRSYAGSDANCANRKQEVRAADFMKASAGSTNGDSSPLNDEIDLSSTANKHRPRTRKDPRDGRHPAVDRWIQERA
jgi:hypothetical protein